MTKSDAYKDRLRAMAEARQAPELKKKTPGNEAEYRNLVEELQIHQIELEIQNEELRNAQKAMEETRDRYLSLFENAPVGYVILDQAGMVKQFNTPFADMFQIQAVKRTGMAFADLLSRKDAAVFRARFAALFKNPAGKMMEATVRSADGCRRHVQVTAAAHTEKQAHGSPDDPELLLMVTDITDLKHAKQSLEKSLNESRIREREISGFLKVARAVLEQENFEKTARKVFDICSELAAIALQNSWHLEKRSLAEKANEKLIHELQKSLANVKQLSGLLPICAHCKKIRDDQGYWEQLESYLDRHSEVKFSHGICQDCLKKHYPEFCDQDHTGDGGSVP